MCFQVNCSVLEFVVRQSLERLLPELHKRRLSQRSWSQEGEDLMLARFFGDQSKGFYVDIGAHHPFLYSNTQLLYERGWRGINVDAMPGSMRAFRRYRRRDTNLEVGVGRETGVARMFVFNLGLLNTFDEELAREREVPPFRIEQVIDVPVKPLAAILAEHVPPGIQIDLLTVDVEGRDLDVLESSDWSAYRPRAILAECYGTRIGDIASDPVVLFLGSRGYEVLGKTVNTCMFVERSH